MLQLPTLHPEVLHLRLRRVPVAAQHRVRLVSHDVLGCLELDRVPIRIPRIILSCLLFLRAVQMFLGCHFHSRLLVGLVRALVKCWLRGTLILCLEHALLQCLPPNDPVIHVVHLKLLSVERVLEHLLKL